jgi:hypothetical protein
MYIFNGKYKNGSFLCRQILNHKLIMPKEFSPVVADFVTRLLDKNPRTRLGGGKDGAQNIKKHPFFSVMSVIISDIYKSFSSKLHLSYVMY